ncbi:hypothetical protein Y1Q_0003155 [Alligator mississippiensis]|uniref:Uncharacterized protein n=1 Tax=Alligator mississippiensis TaxID=8496 RepID=A0A151MDP1_ALLMI|nr:hypothetical protein Y1Q_0003155 [Alligator mississippiensis]
MQTPYSGLVTSRSLKPLESRNAIHATPPLYMTKGSFSFTWEIKNSKENGKVSGATDKAKGDIALSHVSFILFSNQ